ncbi:unnamed protein product [marine sediment metagenome]|uniref:Uncharacterized protein n=1 Tax=marine sediment metagenome TaxID=412755 RepID=X1IH83_9ZZZZ
MALGEHGPKNYDAVFAELRLEQAHETRIFPEETDRIVEFTAGTPANSWSIWAEIEDDSTAPKKLSDKGTSNMHLSASLIEDLSDGGVRYVIEIAYGDDKIVVSRHRFVTGVEKKLVAITYARIRADHIPAGEKIYYRMMCAVALATCEVSIRYHLHK